MRRRAIARLASALLAVLMLSYAAVRSNVMQAAMAAGVSDGPSPVSAVQGMAGMAMDRPLAEARAAKPHRTSPVHGSVQANCAWCSAAAHLPLLGPAEPFLTPTAFVFARWRATAAGGPRGPPRTTPRARGPPDLSLQG